jgi:hypothetical protein
MIFIWLIELVGTNEFQLLYYSMYLSDSDLHVINFLASPRWWVLDSTQQALILTQYFVEPIIEASNILIERHITLQ